MDLQLDGDLERISSIVSEGIPDDAIEVQIQTMDGTTAMFVSPNDNVYLAVRQHVSGGSETTATGLLVSFGNEPVDETDFNSFEDLGAENGAVFTVAVRAIEWDFQFSNEFAKNAKATELDADDPKLSELGTKLGSRGSHSGGQGPEGVIRSHSPLPLDLLGEGDVFFFTMANDSGSHHHQCGITTADEFEAIKGRYRQREKNRQSWGLDSANPTHQFGTTLEDTKKEINLPFQESKCTTFALVATNRGNCDMWFSKEHIDGWVVTTPIKIATGIKTTDTSLYVFAQMENPNNGPWTLSETPLHVQDYLLTHLRR